MTDVIAPTAPPAAYAAIGWAMPVIGLPGKILFITVPTSAAAPMPVTAFPTMPDVRTLEILEPARLVLDILRFAILLVGLLLFELDDLRLDLDDLRLGS
jgi:hypothetical protein